MTKLTMGRMGEGKRNESEHIGERFYLEIELPDGSHINISTDDDGIRVTTNDRAANLYVIPISKKYIVVGVKK